MKDGIIKDILDATDGGLTIMEDIYPMVTKNNKRITLKEASKTEELFSIRNEKVGSAHLRKRDGIWYLHDFGDNKGDLHAIALYADVENIPIKEAIWKLLRLYPHVKIETDEKPVDVRYEPLMQNEVKGMVSCKVHEGEIPEDYCTCFGRNVTPEVLMFYNWELVDEMRICLEDKAMIKKSTMTRPIFRRTCYYTQEGELKQFYKVYEPKERNKRYRFRYYPREAKPKNYVDGIYEVEKWFAAHSEELQNNKLDSIYIASGEKDAMNIHAFKSMNPLNGHYSNRNMAIWFNSETAGDEIKKMTMFRLRRMAKKIINVPDIDNTGIEAGNRFAKENWDIYTLQLPKILLSISDFRGNPSKDFADWVSLGADQDDCSKLSNNAHRMTFWSIVVKKDKNDNEKLEVVINKGDLIFALEVLGYRYICENGDDCFYKEDKHIISRMYAPAIKNEFCNYLRENIVDSRVVETIIGSKSFNDCLKALPAPKEDVSKSDAENQRFYLQDKWVNITTTNVEEKNYRQLDCDINVARIRDYKIGTYRPQLEIEWNEQAKMVDVVIINNKNKLLQYLIATSMMYWKENIEAYRADGKYITQEYLPLDLSSPYLSFEQQEEQIKAFRNKLYLMGYMLSSHKNLSMPYIAYLLDNAIGEGMESNGGSGKSLFCLYLNMLNKEFFIDGKNEETTKSKFLYSGIDKTFNHIRIDDVHRKFNIEQLFSLTSGPLYVEEKGKTPYNIPFSESPKLILTSNYVPLTLDASTKRRIKLCPFSSYFHVKTNTNGYENDWTPRMLWHKELITEFDQTEITEVLSLMFNAVQYFMLCRDHDIVEEAIVRNIEIRQLRITVGAEFLDWFQLYFNPTDGHVNEYVNKHIAYQNYRNSAQKPIGQNMFTRKLKQYCEFLNYTYNPPELCTSGNRIMKKEMGEIVEYFYIEPPKK